MNHTTTNQLTSTFEFIKRRLKELKNSDITEERWTYLRMLKELFIMTTQLKSIAEKFGLDTVKIENTSKHFIQEMENYKLYKQL